jgi:hypothetical protein
VLDRPTIRNVLSMLVELGINSSAVRVVGGRR